MRRSLASMVTLLLLVPSASAAEEESVARIGIEARDCTTTGAVVGADKVSVMKGDLWRGTCELVGQRLTCMARFQQKGTKKLGTGESEWILAFTFLPVEGEAAAVFQGDGHNSLLLINLEAERFSYTTTNFGGNTVLQKLCTGVTFALQGDAPARPHESPAGKVNGPATPR